MEARFNITQPLTDSNDHEDDNNNSNRIYDFSPEKVQMLSELDPIDNQRHIKRVKSIHNIFNPVVGMSKNNSSNNSRYTSNKRKSTRKPHIKLPNLESANITTNQYNNTLSSLSDSEFSFTSNSDSDMDLESLPDLVDDNNTPISSPKHPLTPNDLFLDRPRRIISDYEPTIKSSKGKNKIQLQLEQQVVDISNDFSVTPQQPSIFEIPELVYKIMEFASIQNDNSPKEISPIRRRPLSFKHALLIHGNEQMARKSMESINHSDNRHRDDHYVQNELPSNILFNCLTVNKLFNSIAQELLAKRFYFNDEYKLNNFVQNSSKNMIFKPTEFKLHKLYNLKSGHLEETFQNFQVTNLETIEIFMCPKFLPPEKFLKQSNGNIKKIMICGSKVLDDNYLMRIGQLCPNLEVLDIRGCELVTDSGIYHLGKYCSKLINVNLGRKNRGHLITDAGIKNLFSNNHNLITVGLAGCHITDKSIWDLTINNSVSLQRLSLNNCPYVTNQAIPLILQADYLPNLNVLEIRFTKINNLTSIVEFKRRQELKGISILIELCEELCLKMRQQEIEMDRIISKRIFNDIQDWANDNDDGDSCYLTLLNSRSL